jgi:hypothetical protein
MMLMMIGIINQDEGRRGERVAQVQKLVYSCLHRAELSNASFSLLPHMERKVV